MAASPQMVILDCTVVYDGVRTNLMRGQVMDIPAGSPLLSATTYAPPQRTGTTGSAALSTRIVSLSGSQLLNPGASDSLGPADGENAMGGGVNPYNTGQVG